MRIRGCYFIENAFSSPLWRRTSSGAATTLGRAERPGNKKTAQVEKPCAAITDIQKEEIQDPDFFIPAIFEPAR